MRPVGRAEEGLTLLEEKDMPRSPRFVALVGVLALGVAAVTANAGISQPDLQINWSIDGGMMNMLNPTGVDADGDGIWNFNGGDSDGGGSGIFLNWALAADPDPELSGNISLFNSTANTIDVFVQMILPVAVAGPATTIEGSAALSMTSNGDGGAMATTDTTDLWRAFMDGAEVASLFGHPYDLTNPGFGTLVDDQAFGPQAGPGLMDTMAIELRFTLTPFDQASLTSVFTIELAPAPGTLLVLASGLFVTRRRRR
jgi:hypothetical protein